MANEVKYRGQDILRYKTSTVTQSNKYRAEIGDNKKEEHSRQGFPLRRASASSVRCRKRWRFRNRETPSAAGHLKEEEKAEILRMYLLLWIRRHALGKR